MHKIKYFVDKRIITTLYYSLPIYRFLIYAIPKWGRAAEVYLNDILDLQKSTVRNISRTGRNFNLGALAPNNVYDYTIERHPWQVSENHKPRVHPRHVRGIG